MSTGINCSKLRSKLNLFQCFNIIYAACCLMGCGYQIYLVSSDYLSYNVVTMVSVTMPSVMMAPAISVCIHYGNILDHSKKSFNKSEPMNIFTFEDRYTVREILDSVPQPDRFMFESCLYRLPQSFTLKDYKGDDCYKIFKVEQFFTQVWFLMIISKYILELELSFLGLCVL